MQKSLSAILAVINAVEVAGPDEAEISGITYDSRRVKPGWIFCALPGIHTDGLRFAGDAVDRGAAAVLYEKGELQRRPGTSYIRVRRVREAMSKAAATLNDYPSLEIPVIGVTGTDGKSTTVYFTHQLLQACGIANGFLSTVAVMAGDSIEINPFRQSTPEAPEIHDILRQMIDHGKRLAVVEATSHGLSRRTARLADVGFAAAVLTNITHEHLEFHGNFEQYRDDKANLFRAIDSHKSGFGVVNADDPGGAYCAGVTRRPVFSYSISGNHANLRAMRPRQDSESITVDVAVGDRIVTDVRLNTPGLFNVENLLASTLAAAGSLATIDGAEPSVAAVNGMAAELLRSAPALHPVKGRLAPVRGGQPFSVMVDYAHTPGAFAKVLPMMRTGLKGRMIVVFGSGGERDMAKRPLQGRAACENADIVLLADEDPRGEAPMEILEQIAAGCQGRRRGEDLFLIPNRREAIRKAFSLARPGDLVLLLGKGHEYSIIYESGPIRWDEEEEAWAALGEMGYGPVRTEN
ncbi:MAG TPA: UDP-N-acetylmuramoyl-L-alanyl-D-glutamate--2,6-diaminopimelate ligase [Spirochaetia bacterium]|nr:UDP-N-acetylmuramoyl-L-alanyl-D-glutamate--2,6-diaminopimelate ligase [Spirochaetia bacterium]